MDDLRSILDALIIPELGFSLGFLVIFIFFWVLLRRFKGIKRTLAVLELGHLEFYYQSAEMRKWRQRLVSMERTDMKALQSGSMELLNFFDRIGLLVQQKILPKKEVWQSFGTPILGYFSFLVPYIQWLRTEERDADLFLYFEDLNEAVYRLNRRMDRKRAQPLMEEEELKQFIEEEKAALSDA